ncbi:MAG: hypothetical protein QOF48_1741 [Verrucomicrobiota bacterium]
MDLNPVAAMVMDVIIDEATMRGSHKVCFPTKVAIQVLIGGRALEELDRALVDLKGYRMIDLPEAEIEGQRIVLPKRRVQVTLIARSANWTAKERVTKAEVDMARRGIVTDPDDQQIPLPNFEPTDLDATLAEEDMKAAVHRLHPESSDHPTIDHDEIGRHARNFAIEARRVIEAPPESSDGPTIATPPRAVETSDHPTRARRAPDETSDGPTIPAPPSKNLEVQRSSKASNLSKREVARDLQAGEERPRCVTFRSHPEFVAWAIAAGGVEFQRDFGGQWWARWKEDPSKFRRCWDDALHQEREGRVKAHVGAVAQNNWKHFSGKISPAAAGGSPVAVTGACTPESAAESFRQRSKGKPATPSPLASRAG